VGSIRGWEDDLINHGGTKMAFSGGPDERTEGVDEQVVDAAFKVHEALAPGLLGPSQRHPRADKVRRVLRAFLVKER
jgi:hypothetical protein